MTTIYLRQSEWACAELCDVPKLGVNWISFKLFVYLPLWRASADPGCRRPFTSVTHWAWGELHWEGKVLSLSKREAYMRYIELPRRSGRSFELAAKLFPDRQTGTNDVSELESNGWRIADPSTVARSPSAYQSYISASRAEILCPKPIFRELNTGWFSNRSCGYLASGRPVLAEQTGFSDYLPTGAGLLAFQTMEEALDGVTQIDADYPSHMRAARGIAEEYLAHNTVLPKLIDDCMATRSQLY